MSSPEHKPAGFCPHCDYPIDAGLCPECGEFVAEANLQRSSRKVRIRRVLRRLKHLFVLALVGGLGYGVYHEIQPDRWVRYVSTEYLIDLEARDAGDHVRLELDRRFVEDELSVYELDELLRLRLAPPRLLETDKWPSNVECELYFTDKIDCRHQTNRSQFHYDGFEHGYSVVEDEILVNGEKRVSHSRPLDLNRELLPILNELKIGDHLIERRQRRRISWFPAATLKTSRANSMLKLNNAIIGNYSMHHFFVHRNKIKLSVVEKFPTGIIQGNFDRLRREELLRIDYFFELFNYNRNQRPQSFIRMQLAGQLRIEPLATDAIDPTPLIIRIPHDTCDALRLMGARGTDMKRVKVTFTPDAALAFDANYEEYFDGIIHWEETDLLNGLGLPDSVEPNE